MSSKVNPVQKTAQASKDKETPLKKVEKPITESEAAEKSEQTPALCQQSFLATLATNVAIAVLIWAVIWSITGPESLPGGEIFGILFLFYCSVIGGKLILLVKIPGLPPFPQLLGMLLAGFLLRNIPFLSNIVQINVKWGSTLRNTALSIILALAGLGLDPQALKNLKGVCFRLSLGPCIIEASSAAVLSHFIMKLPWEWGFMLGFVLGAVSPAIVVLSMLKLQSRGYGVEKGIPTLLIAAGSLDDIVAITGFNIFLSMGFSSGSTFDSFFHGLLEIAIGVGSGTIIGLFLWYFPGSNQEYLVLKRAVFVIGFAVFAIMSSKLFGYPGSGGLSIIILAFLGGISWSDKDAVQEIVSFAWTFFQPFLFGLIGAEISVVSLEPKMVGFCLATLILAVLIRVLATFFLVTAAGFNFKEKLFIALAWIPKATVQAAIGSIALDTARSVGNKQQVEYGLNILTLAFLAILITAPTGAMIIGLAGPQLLQQASGDGETRKVVAHL